MTMLTKMIGFVQSSNTEKAKAFYGGALGFRLISDDDFALVFDANGTMLRVVKSRAFTPAQGTILGWEVNDVRDAVRELTSHGIPVEHYNLPFLAQDDLGVWTAPNGDEVAWFKDPDGNVLSISHHVVH